MDGWIECDECEERLHCPEANRCDGCEFGIKTTEETKGEDEQNE